ncbi:MAG: L-rhamnose isomerase [Planctomycetota bacterium]
MPWSAVWTEFCARANVHAGWDWLPELRVYERDVQLARK